MKKQERQYQTEAKTAVKENLAQGISKQLLVMATGTGKTYTSVSLISELQNEQEMKRVLWGTHLEELVEQSAIALLSEMDLMPYDSLLAIINNAGGLLELIRNNKNDMFLDNNTKLILSNIGIVKADLFDIDKPIVVASMQTLHRRLERIPNNWFDIMVCDEAHLFGANTFVKSVNYFDVKLRLGLTATPHRTDGMLMGDIFDKIVYEYGIDKGIEDGYLCELDAKRIATNINIDKVRTTAGEFNQKDLEVLVNTPVRNNMIVDKYNEYAAGRQFIAYCVDVQHARDLNDAFLMKGFKTNFIVGDENLTPNRRGLISQLKNKELDGLTNCMVLTTGFDYPDLGCIINAAPTKSLTKFIQCIGRGARLKSNSYVDVYNQNCIILDIVDSTAKHRLVNTWTLDKGKPFEEKTFMTREQKTMLIAQREAKYKLADPKQKKDVKVNLFALPKTKYSDSIRMEEAATEAQIAWIVRLGFNPEETHYTKGMCNKIISDASATEKQVAFLKWKGYDVSNGVTIGEAALAFEELKVREEAAKKEARAKELAKETDLPFDDVF